MGESSLKKGLRGSTSGSSLEYIFEKNKFELKGLGVLFFVPFFVNYGLIAFMMYVNYIVDNPPEAVFFDKCCCYIPLMSCWWMLLIFREYVEGEGRELLALYEQSKIKDAIFLFVVYFLTWFPLVIFYFVYGAQENALILDASVQLLVAVFVRCVFYFGISFGVLFLTRKIMVPFLFIMIYYLASQSIYHVSNQLIMAILRPDNLQSFLSGCIGIGIGVTSLRWKKE